MNRLTLTLLHLAFFLTDLGVKISELSQHVLVHRFKPALRLLPCEVACAYDLRVEGRSNSGLVAAKVEIGNRWMARKLRKPQTAHDALFPIADQLADYGFQAYYFNVRGESYHVEWSTAKQYNGRQSFSITIPSLI